VNEMSLADVVSRASASSSGRRSRRSAERRRRKRRRRTGLILLVTLVLLGGAVGGAWLGLRPLIASLTAPTDYPGPGTGSVEVRIPEGATGADIGELLRQKDVVLTARDFVTAYKANPRSATIQPGTYTLKQKMTAANAVEALLDEANRIRFRVTIKEGVRAADIPGIVAKGTTIPLAELQAALKNPTAIGLPPQAKGDPEGWLFPATYDVQPGSTAVELYSQMVVKAIAELDSLGVPVAQRQQTIILASLVQAEGKLPVDFPKISRVLRNRLDRGMKLQLDTTVHYATGHFKVSTSFKETQVKSPYNTYLVPGLPVGAIGNPGRVAIKAVQAPADGPWLYFVATNPDTGETAYATTPAEFAVIKAKYEAWQRANPGK
jgi:UPF0755 protein